MTEREERLYLELGVLRRELTMMMQLLSDGKTRDVEHFWKSMVLDQTRRVELEMEELKYGN